MPSDTEMKKRANYHDLGRDDWMSLDEYLQSGLSDRDLGLAEGGLASLPGYDTGGPVGSQLFGVDRPSQRTPDAKYGDVIRKIGEVLKKNWVTDEGKVDFKKFNRFALKQGVDAKDKSRPGKSNLVRFLNSFSKQTGMKYKPVIYDEPGRGTKSFTAESKIKQQPGTRGAPSNEEIYDKGKKLNRTALKKFPNSKTERLKYIVDGLYKKFHPYRKVTKKFLKEFVKKGKFLSPWGMMTGLAMEMMEDPDYMNAIGLGEPQQQWYKGGGMANIYDMTKPLGYAGGGFEDRMSMLRKAMTDTEATRRADMETGDPEMGRTSTFGTVTERNIEDVAWKIARQQGDTSQENINLIIRQLMALTPSMEQTMGEQTKTVIPKGLDALKEKASIMMGLKSDPMLRRDVGFERVR